MRRAYETQILTGETLAVERAAGFGEPFDRLKTLLAQTAGRRGEAIGRLRALPPPPSSPKRSRRSSATHRRATFYRARPRSP